MFTKLFEATYAIRPLSEVMGGTICAHQVLKAKSTTAETAIL